MDLHHPLLAEFPEYKEVILKLRLDCGPFRKMFEEYHRIDDQICRIEEDVERAGFEELEDLKMRRVALKDAIYHQCWQTVHSQNHQSSMVAA